MFQPCDENGTCGCCSLSMALGVVGKIIIKFGWGIFERENRNDTSRCPSHGRDYDPIQPSHRSNDYQVANYVTQDFIHMPIRVPGSRCRGRNSSVRIERCRVIIIIVSILHRVIEGLVRYD
jgi:hypothetical protein